MEKVGKFLGHLKYIIAILYICTKLQFGIFSPVLVYVLCQEKTGNPDR
jgi:hypothetical protein